MSEDGNPGWNLSSKEHLQEISDSITEVLNRNGPAFPFGFVGTVESIRFTTDDYALAIVDGVYANNKKARLRYRIKLYPEQRHWIIKSFVELGKGKCTEDCSKECVVLSSFPYVSLFEEAILEYRRTRCQKDHPNKPVESRRVVCDSTADVFLFCVDGKDEVDACHYHLCQDEFDCWHVAYWECPK